MEIMKRKHKILFDVGIRRVIYPLDTTFIHDLAFAFAMRWIEAGWNIEKTNFFEVDYLTTPIGMPPKESIPSGLFAGIVYAWSKKVYFKVVAFSKGYLDFTDDLALKTSIWHEKQHIINAEEYLHKGIKSPTENDIVKKEIEYVRKTFGKQGYEAFGNQILSKIKRYKNSDTVPGFVALSWLREYFGEHYEEYAHNAFSIPCTEHAETFRQACSEDALVLMQLYSAFDKDVRELFRYTWEDMGR